MVGKKIRLARLMHPGSGTTVIVPMDHGVSLGPVAGLENMGLAIEEAAAGGANAVVVHKGFAGRGRSAACRDLARIVHLSGSTSLSGLALAKTLVCSVEEAIKLGADAVSVHVNVGNAYEREMLADLGRVAREAGEWGMPLLAMIYPRGERIKNEFDPEAVGHAARLGAELGADLVKVPYTGDPATFAEVVRGAGIPVVIAGGPKMSTDREVLEMVHGAMSAGAAGLSIGRNVFQHHAPAAMIRAMSRIVHEGGGVNEALTVLARDCARKAA